MSKVICEFCGREFKSKNGLAIHKHWKHNINPEWTKEMKKIYSEAQKKHLSKLTKEQMAKRMKKSANSVPKWNKGKKLPLDVRGNIAFAFWKKRVKSTDYWLGLLMRKFKGIEKKWKSKIDAVIYDSLPFQKLPQTKVIPKEKRKRISEKVKQLYSDPEYRRKYKLGRAKMSMNKEWRKNVSKGVKRWIEEHPKEAEEIIKKARKNCQYKPTKLEIQFEKILETYFPKVFKYVGDGKTFIGRKNPDFICFEKKKIIEVFGDYWHDKADEEKILEYYKNHNWSALVIWEHETKHNVEEVVKKVREFVFQ